MTWFADLSPCDYLGLTEMGLRAIGWLEPGHEFSKGDVEPAFFDKLCELLASPWCPGGWGGVHLCGLAPCRRDWHGNYPRGPLSPVGGTVLIVPGVQYNYVTPNTIAHCIQIHGYAPPQEFATRSSGVRRCTRRSTFAPCSAAAGRTSGDTCQ